MVERLVKEIESGLKNKCYISALSTALILPDICGKAKYPSERTSVRYNQWLKEYVCNKQPFGIQAEAEIIYDLRCRLLHEGNPSINTNKYKIKKFALIVRKNSAHIPLESCWFEEKPDGSRVCEWYNINIVFLCKKICEAALTYYTANQELFDFFDFRIISTDDQTAQSFKLPEDIITIKF